ncbi:hypothetical protein [Aliikangiella maris]|uniref:Uncharacterized protein n=2 Tax=Aliikangiella maris TaxID=3162458 RepID=A0ABV2BU46_9GAMM
MDKLSNFYLELSTNATKMARYNRGANEQEVFKNRRSMLESEGIEASDEIISLSQSQLHEILAQHLGNSNEQWRDLKNYAGNTDNNVGKLGKRSH